MSQNKITTRQAFLIMIGISSTSVLQPSFRHFMLWAGNGAWLPLLLALGFGVGFVWLLLLLVKRFPDQSIAEYAPKVMSPLLGYPLVLLLIITFLLGSTFALRNVSEFFVASILPETPISATILVMLVLTAYALSTGLEGLVRFNELATPIIVGSFLLVLVSNIRLNVWHLLPVFDRGWAGLPLVFQSVSSDLAIVTYLLFIYPSLTDPQTAGRTGRRYIMGTTLLMLFIYLHTLLLLGSEMGATFTWPYLVVTENMMLLERGEALFIVVWMFAAFLKISFSLYIASLGICQLIPKLRPAWVGVGLLPLVAYLSLQADNQPGAVAAYQAFSQYAFYIRTAIPLIILATAVIRRKGVVAIEQEPS